MRHRVAASRGLGLTLGLVLALGLAACSSTPGADSPGSTKPSSATSLVGSSTTSTSTSTTTTTTPVPVPVGAGATSVARVRVAALAPGASALPFISPSSSAWLKMVPIAYTSVGSGPDLLLIEGQDGSLSWWNPTLVLDLALHYRVTMFDLPGAGYSGAPTAPLSLAWLADMTAGFALTVGLSHPVVLGWGLGGEIALSLAERHPGFASSLVLVDTTGGGAAAARPSKTVDQLLALPGATPSELSTLLFPATPAGTLQRIVWKNGLFTGINDWLTAPTIAAEARLQQATWKSSPVTAGLAHVTTPALVASGADDIVFPPANASLLGSELPHATVVLLPGAGYGAIDQDAPGFVAALEKFTH